MPYVIGLNSTVLENKLVEANEIVMSKTVYLASLREMDKEVWIHFCSAYFVNTNCFITTGTCIEKLKTKEAFNSSKVQIHVESQRKGNLIDYTILMYDKLDDYNGIHQNDNCRIPDFDLGIIKVNKIFHYDLIDI